jgi:dihydropteroate synthase
MSFKSKEILNISYEANGKILRFGKPLVMAIVNCTPDSFYDGGKYHDADDVLRDVEEKIKNGAHIIDLGAASSRPNSAEISATEEASRLLPVLQAVRSRFPDVLISVDTFRAGIAAMAAENGADIINDIGGCRLDPAMAETVAGLDLPYILMHMDGNPQTMAQNPPYENVVQTVGSFFEEKIKYFRSVGFEKIILDPGFGFGKSLKNNYQLLKGLEDMQRFQLPVLAGVSRKSMIGKIIGSNPVTSLNGSTVLHTIALLNGASILRVHDVSEALQAVALVEFYLNA